MDTKALVLSFIDLALDFLKLVGLDKAADAISSFFVMAI